jgi:hypothetical protein
MKEDKDNITGLKLNNFNNFQNLEEVPYLNNDGDIVQDMLKKIEKNTETIQDMFISNSENKVIDINFKNDNQKHKN